MKTSVGSPVLRTFELPSIDRAVQIKRVNDLKCNHPARTPARKRIRRFVRHCSLRFRLSPPVLDVGAGYRSNEPEICARQLLDFYTLDISPQFSPDLICDAMDMCIVPTSFFGTCVSTELLEHVEQPQKVVTEIRRVLKPDGLAIFTVPFWVCIHEKPGLKDYWRFTPRAMRFLLSQFIIEEFHYSGVSNKPEGIFVLARKPTKFQCSTGSDSNCF